MNSQSFFSFDHFSCVQLALVGQYRCDIWDALYFVHIRYMEVTTEISAHVLYAHLVLLFSHNAYTLNWVLQMIIQMYI